MALKPNKLFVVTFIIVGVLLKTFFQRLKNLVDFLKHLNEETILKTVNYCNDDD